MSSKKVFISASSEPFEAGVQLAASEVDKGKFSVRRPLRGIVLKKDSYATLSVINEFGEVRELTNESVGVEPVGGRTSNFLLTGVREDRTERAQVVNTFGDSYIYFYGQNPPSISGVGLLINTADFQWSSEFWDNYEKNFRGTALARTRRRVILEWDEELVCGYFLRASISEDSEKRNIKTLNFQMVVTDRLSKHIFSTKLPEEEAVSLDQLNSFRERMRGITTATYENRIAIMEAYAKSQSEKYEGFLGTIQEGVDTVKGAIGYLDRAMDSVQDFLFGSPLTIPKGYAASEYMTGPVEYAAGSIDPSTGLPEISFSDEGGALSRTVTLSGEFSKPTLGFVRNTHTDPHFYTNKDEYLTGDTFPGLEQQLANAKTAANLTFPDRELEDRAKAMLEKFGLEEPSDPSVAGVLAGKAAFAVIGAGAQAIKFR